MMSGRRRNSAASATRMVSPPDSRSTRSSRPRCASPSRSSQARARSSTSQSSPTAAKASSPVSPASMACRASRAAVMPSRSETLRWVPSVMACGRYPTSPRTRTAPEPGRSSPAINRSRVDLPEPLTPISPVRPRPKDAVRPESTEAPSGQLKLRSEQTIAAVIRRGSQHVGMISVTCGDTTPRGLSPRSRACQTGTSAVSLTSQPQRTSPTADSRDSLIVATPTRPANAISPWRRPGDSMIVNSFWRHLPQTVHDHEKRL